MRCYSKILRISYKDHATNDEVHAKIQQAIRWCGDILTIEKRSMQTEVVWTCLPFIRSGQNHLARHRERGKKTRRTEEEVGKQHQGMDRLGVCQVPEGSGEQGKMEETGSVVVKSFVVPQKPSRLRDRWWWWWRWWEGRVDNVSPSQPKWFLKASFSLSCTPLCDSLFLHKSL